MKLPYFLVKPAVVLPLLAAGAFAVHAPIEWTASPYWPTAVLNIFSYIFPPISGYAGSSKFPEITRMYMSLTFLLMPLQGWYTYLELSTSTNESWFKNLWNIESNWALVKRAALVAAVGAVTYFALLVNPGYDFNLMPLNTSRNALAVGGWIVAGGIQAAGMAWMFCNFLVFIRFFKGNKNV